MTDVFSTVPTAWLLAAEQAFAAGGPAINLGGGTLKVGDGNGVVPTADSIIANGGVLHQVWQGPVNGGEVDAGNALQINVNCLIPTVDSSGAEIGPFTVREFAIYDAGGHLALVGTTNLPKTVSSSGQPTTLQWWACYAAAVANSVTVQPPPGSFPTLAQVAALIANALATALAAIPGAATIAQVIAGVAANVWISPATLVGALNGATLGSALSDALAYAVGLLYPGGSNWRRLPGGLVLQWGAVTFPVLGGTASNLTITYPVTFPTGTLWVGGTATNLVHSVIGGVPSFGAESASASGFYATIDNLTGFNPPGYIWPINQPVPLFWIALGH